MNKNVLAAKKVLCSRFACSVQMVQDKMIHVNGAYYCSPICRSLQLADKAVRKKGKA